MNGRYRGQHAFVFWGGGDDSSAIIADLQRSGDINPDIGPVHFISALEGPFAGFAHIAQDDVGELADYIHGRLWDAGIRHGEYAVEGHLFRGGGPPPYPKGPTRKLFEFIALCRIYVNQPPVRVLERIGESFAGGDPFAGGSTVIGAYQLLVELGGDALAPLELQVAALNDIAGVERVETGFAAAPGTAAS
jgi:hypothetical protein